VFEDYPSDSIESWHQKHNKYVEWNGDFVQARKRTLCALYAGKKITDEWVGQLYDLSSTRVPWLKRPCKFKLCCRWDLRTRSI
jgi:hypothetical protein